MSIIFTSHKRSLRRLCFYTCLSVHREGGSPGPHQGWRLKGLAGGISRPTPEVEVEGSGWGSLQTHTWGGCPDPHPGGVQAQGWGGISQHALRQTPPSRWLLLWVVHILLERILVTCDIFAHNLNRNMYKILFRSPNAIYLVVGPFMSWDF